jgi:hypothetical protein
MLFSRVGVSGFGSRQSSSSSSLLLLLLAVAAAAAVSSMVADVVVDVVVAGVVVGVVVGAAGVGIDFKTDGLTPVRGLGRDISLWPNRTEITFCFRLL